MENNVNLYMFRDLESVIPMWECFPQGGLWILKVRKSSPGGARILGKLWQDLVFAAIGEQFDEPSLMGVTLATRPNGDILSVWNADNRCLSIRFKIGEKMKDVLGLDASTVLEYKHFRESLTDGSSYSGAKQYVYQEAK